MDGKVIGNPQFPVPKKTLAQKLSEHKKLVILASVVLLLLIGTGTYFIISPARKTIVMPASQENLPPIVSPSTKKATKPTAGPTATPTPPPSVTSWKTYTNSIYRYNIKYPPAWTVQNLGSLEPKVPSYIVFNPSSASSSARSITVLVSTRTYAEQLALGASGSAITVAGIKGTKQSFQDSDGNTSTAVVLPRTGSLLVLRSKTAYLNIFNIMLTTLKITN